MTAGIVCEYNPFHKGHLYHIKKTKEQGADYIVCVMSGNFVQRGECAYFDKWIRAEAAVRNGADVVIDLPVPWSCSSAENFAMGSVGLLCDFGIDVLSFGSESDDKELLIKCAEAIDDEKVKSLLKQKMSEGLNYPAALSEAVGKLCGENVKELLSKPNSTLAVEYIRALKAFSGKVSILPVRRMGSEHDGEAIIDGFASASKIRKTQGFENTSELIPTDAFSLFDKAVKEGGGPYKMEYGERAVLSTLREMKREEYDLYVSDSSGLSSRIYDAVKNSSGLDELYMKAKSKNYTHSRIRREVMSLYLKIPEEIAKGKVPYMRILAVSQRGLGLLSKAKENSSVPIVTRHSQMSSLCEKAKTVYGIQCTSSDKFALFSEKAGECSTEQKHSMIKINADK